MPLKIRHTDGIVVVDVQMDFCPGGALGVSGGDEIIGTINWYTSRLAKIGGLVVFSRDWHPPEHMSFTDSGGPWPRHCVKGTPGAQLHRNLFIPRCSVVVDKATDPEKDAYSAFDGTDAQGRSLETLIRDANVKRLFICGLATDYCVKATTIDALKKKRAMGVKQVRLIVNAIRAVNINPDDGEKAIAVMKNAGAILTGKRNRSIIYHPKSLRCSCGPRHGKVP